MEEVEGRGAVFDVEEPAFLFLCHVKPDLKSQQQLSLRSEKWRLNRGDGPPSTAQFGMTGHLPPWFRWTQSSPCSWLPKGSRRRGTWGGWSSLAFQQTRCNLRSAQSCFETWPSSTGVSLDNTHVAVHLKHWIDHADHHLKWQEYKHADFGISPNFSHWLHVRTSPVCHFSRAHSSSDSVHGHPTVVCSQEYTGTEQLRCEGHTLGDTWGASRAATLVPTPPNLTCERKMA